MVGQYSCPFILICLIDSIFSESFSSCQFSNEACVSLRGLLTLPWFLQSFLLMNTTLYTRWVKQHLLGFWSELHARQCGSVLYMWASMKFLPESLTCASTSLKIMQITETGNEHARSGRRIPNLFNRLSLKAAELFFSRFQH